MTVIQKKIATNYWVEKLKNVEIVNASFGSVCFSEKVFLGATEVTYLDTLTRKEPLAEITVFLAIYTALIKRYFANIEGRIRFNNYFDTSLGIPLIFMPPSTSKPTNFKTYLKGVKKEVQDILEYKNYDEERLYKRLGNKEILQLCTFGLSINTEEADYNNVGMHINFSRKANNEIEIRINSKECFVANHVAKHFLKNCKNYIAHLDLFLEQQLNLIPLLSDKEQFEIVHNFNNTKAKYPQSKTIVAVFENQVAKTPNVAAVQYGNTVLTYRELHEQSNQFGHYLQDITTLKSDDLVGIKLDKTEALLIVIFGILKSGAAYLPIDKNYPQERIAYLERDSNSKMVIDDKALKTFNSSKSKYSKENLKQNNRPDSLAYVMYTSGTTGKPKGVMVEHKNVISLVKPCSFFKLNKKNVVLSTASISFDATIIEFFGTLLNGSKLILTEKDNLLITSKLIKVIKRYNINSLWMTSSWFNQVVDSDIAVFKNIKQLIVGGDIVSSLHVLKVYAKYPSIKIVNGYGPTENTTFSTAFQIENKKYETIPIGKPISNSSAYILDDNMNPVPIGVEGKLYVSGAGVARGYFNRPDLTAQKFTKNPFVKGERIYNTGDIALWLPNGLIQFIGRKDYQVKIRGYRIELEEIENTVLTYSKGLKRAIVMAKEINQEKKLVLYFVSEKEIDKVNLRAFLCEKLPDYMLPSFFIQLRAFPLTLQGKTDRKALLLIDDFEGMRKAYVAPTNSIEESLVKIWLDVLDVKRVGITDDFFELGGHSLMVAQMINSISKSLDKNISFKDFFENPTIKALSSKLENNTYHPIKKTEEKEGYPLTASQNRLWILSQLEGGSLAYNIPTAIQIIGDLDVLAFQESFKRLVIRHEILRTNFRTKDNGLVQQRIIPTNDIDFQIGIIDYKLKKDKEALLEAFITTNNNKPFNLEKGPLIRAFIIQLEAQKAVFFLSLHHIIGDGWSIEVLISEIIKTYNILSQNKEISVPSLSIQYKDYAVWLNGHLKKKTQKLSETYWLSQFEGALPQFEFPTFKRRPLVKTFHGKEVCHKFTIPFLDNIKKFSKKYDVTLFTLLITAVNVLLYKYTGQKDIIIGTPVAGRIHPDLENQIGVYLNTLAIRTKIKEGQCFIDLLEKQKSLLIGAYEHQSYPFDELVNKLKLKRDTSRSALFDVMVILQSQSQLNNINKGETLKDLQISDYNFERKTAQFDLSFSFVEREALDLTIAYNTDIYDDGLIGGLFFHLERILEQVIEYPSMKIEALDFLGKSEKHKILKEFNNTQINYPDTHRTIIDVFEAQVERTPENKAVIFENTSITYKSINKTSNELAGYLRDVYGIQPNDLVGIKLNRTDKMIMTVLGILKSGAAYVPIDIDYPEERITYIEKDSNCKLIIDTNILSEFISVKDKYSNKNIDKINKPDDLAYIIYTSGTTGEPKGVMVTHRNAVELINWAISEFDSSKFDIVYALTSHCFDLSVFEMFYTLAIGKKMRVLNSALDIHMYLKKDHKILINTVPSVIQKIIEENLDLTNVSYINMAGEVIPNTIIKKLPVDKIEIRNLYGPTEDTTYSTRYLISNNDYNKVPIGKPLPNTSIYILDTSLNVVPIGVKGHLYISGKGITKGYFKKPKLTEEKFISNPFIKGDKMYETGDIARWLPDGNLEFLGREDNQVKIRGYRIELGEIENTLLQYSKELKQAVVTSKKLKEDKVLVAYFTSHVEIEYAKLRQYLKSKLPGYMVPDFFIHLDHLPLMPNGKIDKKALPNVLQEHLIREQYKAPETIAEKAVVQIWQDILGIEKIGITDNFFELGGHSLKAVRLINKINKELDLQLAISDIFSAPTIKGLLAKYPLKNKFLDIPKTEIKEHYSLTSGQRRLWIISQFKEGNKAYNIPNVLKFIGKLEIPVLELAFAALISRHESLRTFFQVSDNGVIRQHILPKEKVNFKIKIHENQEINSNIDQVITNNIDQSFNLSQAPLLNVAVIIRSKKETIIMLNLHHIIGDGWSMEVLSNEVMHIYNAYINNTTIELPKLKVQYKDYSAWLQSKEMELHLKRSEKYWKRQFSEHIPVLELPTNLKRPKVKTYKGNTVQHTFSSRFTQLLKQFTEHSEATLFMGLMAGIKGLFYRYTGQTDIVLGIPISGRFHSDLEHQIGLFINTLPIRTTFTETMSFNELLEKEKQVLLSAYEHQIYPFESLVEQLDIKRDMSRSLLFDVMVVLHNQQNILQETTKVTGGEILPYPYKNRGRSHFDISFLFEENDSGISVLVEFNSDIYTTIFVEQLTRHIEQFIIEAVESCNKPMDTLDYLSQSEQSTILFDFNPNIIPYENENIDTLVTVLEKQSQKTPNKIAVIVGESTFTYKELRAKSNQFSHYLTERYQVEKGDFIGVKLERNEFMVITLIAILKLGAIYVPIDPKYPQERVDYLESDSTCKITITERIIANFKPEEWSIRLPKNSISPEDLAYIIYTSGSTGRPKGVKISHRNVVSLMNWSKEEFKNTAFDMVYAVTSYCFDLSIFEIFFPLSCGKKVRVLENGLDIATYLLKDKKVLINTVPSVVEDLLTRDVSLTAIAAINMAGEPIPVKLSNALIKYPLELRNLYGPSEDTSYSSCYRICKKHEQALPIGKPITNTQFYILSEKLMLQPEGVIGELCISGNGLSSGYLNRKDLTQEKFVKNPYNKESILYKTGDLASWMPDGNVNFLGRKDDQVKVKGYRIELGEIENILLLEENIFQAVVMVKTHKGDKLIVAYLLGEHINITKVRHNLEDVLPRYMLPNSFKIINKIPLTTNGKTDKKALLKLDAFDLPLHTYQPPESDIEKKLAQMWQEILGIEKVGMIDNFFELGGDSLKATKLIFSIEKEFEVPINIQDVFENPTIAFLTISIENFKWSTQEKTNLKKIIV